MHTALCSNCEKVTQFEIISGFGPMQVSMWCVIIIKGQAVIINIKQVLRIIENNPVPVSGNCIVFLTGLVKFAVN